MYYLVYRITNTINGKHYIGMHKTDNLEDGYMGSGKLILRAIAKYGEEHFHKEIIACFDNPSDMVDMERLLVDSEFVSDDSTYNLKEGGTGGFDYINSNELTSGKFHRMEAMTSEMRKRGREKQKWLFENDPVYRRQYSEKRRKVVLAQQNFVGRFEGMTHTDESKRKNGIANSKHQSGTGNSQYGTCWVVHPMQGSKKVPKSELKKWIDIGWLKGRKIKK